MEKKKIAIIGAGSVGSTTAYSLTIQNIASEIILSDVDEKRCRGEVLDLTDIEALFPATKIRSGDMHDVARSDIIIIAAGKRQEKGQTRMDLFSKNKAIIQTICAQLSKIQQHTIVIMVTNPVDPLTCLAQKLLPLKKTQIFGSGTFLDSLRLQKLIAETLSVSPSSVSGFVLGEHGDSQFVQWSSAQINGKPISQFQQFDEQKKKELAEKTKQEAYDIISCKGATFFGVASCVAFMCRAILYDQKITIPVSCFLEHENICMSMPVVVGASGIVEYLPLSLSQEEKKQYDATIEFLKQFQT